MAGKKTYRDSVIFSPSDLQIDNQVLLSAIEEKAFQYGLLCGIRKINECPVFFAKIAREILEFLFPEARYDAISVFEKDTSTLYIFPLTNVQTSYLKKVENIARKSLRSKRGWTVNISKHPEIVIEKQGKGKISSINGHVQCDIFFRELFSSSIMIFSRDAGIKKKIAVTPFRNVLTLSCKIILKVYELIKKEQDKTSKIIEDMTDGIILFKDGIEISVINTAAKRILGLPRKGMVDSTKKEFVKMIFIPLLTDFRETGESVEKEIKISYPQEKILKINVSPTGVSQKDALVVIRDITHMKEVERLKDEIISTVSHELRTPLTAIDTMVSNMRMGITGELTDKQKEYLERMKTNIGRLASLINNFLDISKLESGKIVLVKDFHRIDALVGNVHHLLEQQIKTKKIEFSKELKPAGILGYVDLERMEQVMINLIYNAVKFTHAGGHIHIRAFHTDHATLRIDVIDNGSGVEKDELSKIFQKFHQLGRTYGAGEKGTGLGLAICRKIIEMHEGRIFAKSPPELPNWKKGSQFSVELPVKNEKQLLELLLDKSIEKASQEKGGFAFSVISVKAQTNLEKTCAKIKANIKSDVDVLFHFPKSRKIYIIIHCTKKDFSKIAKRLKRILKDSKAGMTSFIYPDNFVEREQLIALMKYNG